MLKFVYLKTFAIIALTIIISNAYSNKAIPEDFAPNKIDDTVIHGTITTVYQYAISSTDFITKFYKQRYATSITKPSLYVESGPNSGEYKYEKINAKQALIIFTEHQGPQTGLSLEMHLTFTSKTSGHFSGDFIKKVIGYQQGTFLIENKKLKSIIDTPKSHPNE